MTMLPLLYTLIPYSASAHESVATEPRTRLGGAHAGRQAEDDGEEGNPRAHGCMVLTHALPIDSSEQKPGTATDASKVVSRDGTGEGPAEGPFSRFSQGQRAGRPDPSS